MIETKPSQFGSQKQMRYYRGVVIKMIAKHNNIPPHTAHDWAKKMFGDIESTSKLTTQEFEDYIYDIRAFCLKQWRLEIPLPNEG